MWLEAESEVAINQSYTIGGKSFTRAKFGRNRKQDRILGVIRWQNWRI